MKVIKMILNIYKLSEFDLNILNELPNNIEIINHDANEIKCKVFLKDFANDIIINLKSKFLFVISDKNFQKREVVKCLKNIFKDKLSYFKPDISEEHEFLCSSKCDYLKFIHDNKIINDEELTKKYCDNELDDDYYFFEAKINFNNSSYFLYYGDVIKIKDKFKEYLNEIINFFVNFSW